MEPDRHRGARGAPVRCSIDLSADASHLQPLVDVLLAVRDGATYLPAALDSLLAQDLVRFRLILVDDASADDSPLILAAAARRDPRITVVRNVAPAGLAASLNRGLALCTAPFVARADADDVYAPHRLSAQLARLEAEPALGVLSCGYHRIGADGRHVDTVVPPTGHRRVRFHLRFANALLHPGTMLRTALLREVGGYDVRYWTAQDSDLWARLAPLARIDNLEEPLVSYRVHAASTMRTRGEAGRALSLSVPRRELGTYLGRALSAHESRAAVELYQGYSTLDRAALLAALGVMRETDRRAADGDGDVRRFFHARVWRGLAIQRHRAGWRSPARASLAAASQLAWRVPMPAGRHRAPAFPAA